MIRFTAFICVGIAFFVVGCSRLNTPNPKLDADMGRKILGHGRAPRTLRLQIRVSLVSRSYERQRHATAIKAAAFRGWFQERESRLLPELRQRRNPLVGCFGSRIVAATRVETTRKSFNRSFRGRKIMELRQRISQLMPPQISGLSRASSMSFSSFVLSFSTRTSDF